MKNRIKSSLSLWGMTCADLAERLGVSETTLSKKLNGQTEFTAKELLIMSLTFQVTVDYILKGEIK